jgi:hypothetical protein
MGRTCGTHEGNEVAYKYLVGKPEGETTLGRTGRKLGGIINPLNPELNPIC